MEIHACLFSGSWLHCGYHLTTSIVAPALLSLPFAFAALGWVAGVLCLIVGALVTFYSYNLLSIVLEHHAQLGQRHLRFRDMAEHILGKEKIRFFLIPPLIFLLPFKITNKSSLMRWTVNDWLLHGHFVPFGSHCYTLFLTYTGLTFVWSLTFAWPLRWLYTIELNGVWKAWLNNDFNSCSCIEFSLSHFFSIDKQSNGQCDMHGLGEV